jgi:dynamin 1-like protein
MAKRVDTPGIRTLGVLTKTDIMDKGTNAKRMLLGQEVQLRLGFIAVKNRS